MMSATSPRRLQRFHYLLTATIATGVLVGCSDNAGEGAAPSSPESSTAAASTATRPTLTASNLQPPVQDNKYTRSSSRPKVVVDPCTWVEDSRIAEAGFDPASRHRGADMIAEYSFLICNFKQGQDQALALESGNVTLDEVRKKYEGKTSELIVNGRPAVQARKGDNRTCSIDLQTKVGYFGITVTTETPGRVKGLEPCDHIIEIATALEPAIGKDN